MYRGDMRPLKKKLLVAAVGVAAMNYACHEKPVQTGNLMAPEPTPPDAGAVEAPQTPDASHLVVSGNLMAPPPPPPTTTAPTPPPDVSHRIRTGNLMPPPPPPPTSTATPKAK